MEVKDILSNYPKVEYLATDGEWYKLSRMYPICLPVKDKPDLLYLDTGGQMQTCDFFQAKLVGEELHRLFDNGRWKRISPRIRITN